uniref:Uncharacterized protein n=1 Tax=Setaria digitata TaxID=48799 RepID=A0A915PDA9_9BILA
MSSETCLKLAETVLLAPMAIKVEDEFSVKPRNMLPLFEAWASVYDAVIKAFSRDSSLCCKFAAELASRISEIIKCEKTDCRLLFIYSQIIRVQIEYFDYDILNDVFVGDFDLSGKGSILDSFCNLLIEIQKHSLRTLRKHTDKRTGIALELMSKSLLNILEAATSLVSLMTEPTHILFVIVALSEFIGNYLALVVEKNCRMLCKSHTNVVVLVKTALNTLKKHYSGPYDTALLAQLGPVFINGLRLSRLRQYLVTFCQQMFDHVNHHDLLDELSDALARAKSASLSYTSEQHSLSALNNSQSTQPLVLKGKTLEHSKNENKEEYVVIDVLSSGRKMRLTDHQKEKLMERSDSLLCFTEESQSVDFAARIPPGYIDSTSHESSSVSEVLEKPPLVKKCDSEYNWVGASSPDIRSGSQNLPTDNSDGSNNRVCDTISSDNKIGKGVGKNFVIPVNTQGIQTAKFDESYRTDSVDQNQATNGRISNSESEIVLSGEFIENVQLETLEQSMLSIRCKTPETAELRMDASPKENVDDSVKTPNSILKKYGRRTNYPAVKFFSASVKKAIPFFLFKRKNKILKLTGPGSQKKCKHVHFDASTLDDDDIYGPPRKKIFRRTRNSLFTDLPPIHRIEPPLPSNRPAVLPTNKNPADAVFPALIESEELIPPQIYLKLAPAMSSLALRSLMKSRGVSTIGDLARMSEQDIETFPFRGPKLSRFLRALEDHFRMKNMMSKEDAIELERIMKRTLNSPGDFVKEIHSKPIDEQKMAKEEQEPHAPDVLDKINSEVDINEINNHPPKHGYVNPFQNGSKRFIPCPAKRLGSEMTSYSSPEKQADQENNQTIAPFEIKKIRAEKQDGSRFKFGYPQFVKNQKHVNGNGSDNYRGSNSVNSSSLSEHSSKEEGFGINSQMELRGGNIRNRELKSNRNKKMKPEGDNDEHDDITGSLRNAYRIFLMDPVFAAVAGISFEVQNFCGMWSMGCWLSRRWKIALLSNCFRQSSARASKDVKPLKGRIALVTGGARGVGRGVALQLGEAGATVYISGRKPESSSGKPTLQDTVSEVSSRGGKAIPVYCDHSKDDEVKELFERIAKDENNRLDVLVNNAFSGATACKKFFECEPSFWDEINSVGLRNVYVCSVLASRMMVPRRKGLIINISSAAGVRYFFNVPYGVGKAAIDRMSADIAEELKDYKITVVSLWPGTVKTEKSYDWLQTGKLSQLTKMPQAQLERMMKKGETPEFVGRAVMCLAYDERVFRKTGCVLMTGDLSNEYMFADNDG